MRMEIADKWDSLSSMEATETQFNSNQLNIFTNQRTESVRIKFIDESNYLRFSKVIILP